MSHTPPRTGAGYETRDARAAPILVFGVSLGLLLLLAVGIAGAMTRLFERRPVAAEHPMAGLRLPPRGPLLQADPRLDLAEQRERTRALTQEYAWIDPPAGVIRIPLERARELALERGFPVAEERGR